MQNDYEYNSSRFYRRVGRDVDPCKEKATPVPNRGLMILIINAIAMRFGLFSEIFSIVYTMSYNPFTVMRLFQMCRKTEN